MFPSSIHTVFFVSEKSPLRQTTTGPTSRSKKSARLLCKNPLGWYPNPAAAKAKLLSAKTEALASDQRITGGSVEFCWQFWDGDFAVSLDAPQFIQSNNLSIPNMQTKARIKHRPDNWESIVMSTAAVDQQNHLVIPTYTRFFHW